jgi:ApaG protein
MLSAITNQVEVRVETIYQGNNSPFHGSDHVFAYQIHIANLGDTTIRLLRRHWHIIDSAEKREVEGEGVVGLQPVLQPGESHEYVSACNLQSETGKMYGTYLFERLSDGSTFYVNIPEFQLLVPFRNN